VPSARSSTCWRRSVRARGSAPPASTSSPCRGWPRPPTGGTSALPTSPFYLNLLPRWLTDDSIPLDPRDRQ
jgi:hypothetical protein